MIIVVPWEAIADPRDIVQRPTTFIQGSQNCLSLRYSSWATVVGPWMMVVPLMTIDGVVNKFETINQGTTIRNASTPNVLENGLELKSLQTT